VRSIYADWERGDFGSADWADGEIELVIADGPQPGRWRGRAEMAEGALGIFDTLEDVRTRAEEYRELDDERVLVLTRISGRGKTSGVDLEHIQTGGAALFYIRDGKVTKHVVYFDRDSALADLGLEA
jgi:ketosteroid isomerase-like protein